MNMRWQRHCPSSPEPASLIQLQGFAWLLVKSQSKQRRKRETDNQRDWNTAVRSRVATEVSSQKVYSLTWKAMCSLMSWVFDRLSDKELRFSLRIQASGRTIDPPRATPTGRQCSPGSTTSGLTRLDGGNIKRTVQIVALIHYSFRATDSPSFPIVDISSTSIKANLSAITHISQWQTKYKNSSRFQGTLLRMAPNSSTSARSVRL